MEDLKKIKRDVEVTEDKAILDDPIGLVSLFNHNDPAVLREFLRRMDDDKFTHFVSFYRDYAKQIEAVSEVNYYRTNIKYGYLTLTGMAALSFLASYLFYDDVIQIMTSYKYIGWSILACVPMAFYNVLNGVSLFYNYIKDDDNE